MTQCMLYKATVSGYVYANVPKQGLNAAESADINKQQFYGLLSNWSPAVASRPSGHIDCVD